MPKSRVIFKNDKVNCIIPPDGVTHTPDQFIDYAGGVSEICANQVTVRLFLYFNNRSRYFKVWTLEVILEATNKACVLGSDGFKNKLEKTLNRPVESRGQSGDRKSRVYRQRNQRVCPFNYLLITMPNRLTVRYSLGRHIS